MLNTSVLPRKWARLARQAATAVSAQLGERMPPVRFVLVNSRTGFADFLLNASGLQTSGWRRARYWVCAYREAGISIGLTVPDLAGGAVVVLRGDLLRRSPDQLWPTLCHELVHAVQMARPGVTARWLDGERSNHGLAPMTRKQAKAHDALVDVEEDEAYRIEAELTDQGQPVHQGQRVPHSPARTR